MKFQNLKVEIKDYIIMIENLDLQKIKENEYENYKEILREKLEIIFNHKEED